MGFNNNRLEHKNNMEPQSRSIHYFTVHFLIIVFIHTWFAPAHAEGTPAEGLEAAKLDFYKGDLDQARLKLQALQDKAGPEADYFLALIHRREGKYRDFDLALSLLQQASSNDYSPAMRELGMAYERGEGVTADLLKALDWYRKADALEKPDGASIEFYSSHEGVLVEQTMHQQMQRLKSAVADGNGDAAYQLAKIHDEGVLVAQNFEQALYWYRVAAEAGHGYSRLMLGYFLCRGIATPKNIRDANRWFELSDRNVSCRGESTK
jgi:TPR repeat protein